MSMEGAPPSGIPVLYNHRQTGLRLLELPPELCELVTAGQSIPLQFKSSPATRASSTVAGTQAFAVLCTPDTTNEVRQVQTSNTVLLLRRADAAQDGTPAGLEAFATCGSTIELSPCTATVKGRSITDSLEEVLPLWRSQSSAPPPAKRGKVEAFADTPFSDSECEAAWRQLMAFDHDGQAWRPAASTLLDLWRGIKACTDVTRVQRSGHLTNVLEVDLVDFPRGLSDAFVSSMSNIDGATNDIAFERDRVVDWIQESYIADIASQSGRADISTVLELWEPLLPEEWLASVTPARLAEMYNDKAEAGPRSASGVGGAGAAAAPGAGAKRLGKSTNWHEKLKKKRVS